MDEITYKFYVLESESSQFGERFLICPKCNEKLRRNDIEAYLRCPFCNFHFERTRQIEDFLLEPAVENWIRRQESLHSGRREDFFF